MDELWTIKEATIIKSTEDLEFIEVIDRLIAQRTPPDGWFRGKLTDFFVLADGTKNSGAGDLGLGTTGLTYSEHAVTPSGAGKVSWEVPSNYSLVVNEVTLELSDQDVGIGSRVYANFGSAATELEIRAEDGEIIQVTLDDDQLTMYGEQEGKGLYWPVHLPAGSTLIMDVAAEVDAGSVLKMQGACKWRREPTWVAR